MRDGDSILTVYTDAVGGGFRRLDEAVQWAREYDSELPPVEWRKDADDEGIATDCGNGGCEYAESRGGMRPVGLCRCNECPACGGNVRLRGHRDWCDRKEWTRGMPRERLA